MRFLPSLTVVLLICITLNMGRPRDDEVDKCQNTVNYFRMEAGLEELKKDHQETSRLQKMFKPGTRSCPTKSHLKNGFGGFTVTRMEEGPSGIDIIPNKNSILSHNVKTFACLDLECEDHPGVVSFAFIKNGIAGKNSESKNEIASSRDTSENPSSSIESNGRGKSENASSSMYSIGKWFLMGAILTIYKLF